VVVYPGVAIDPDGNIIVVSESLHFQLNTTDPGLTYLTLAFQDIPETPAAQPRGTEVVPPNFMVERYLLQQQNQAPARPYLELARIMLSSPTAAVRDAPPGRLPGPDEIDLGHRPVSGPPGLGQVGIGVVALETAPDGRFRHQIGAARLTHAINTTTAYRAQYLGPVALDREVEDCQLLLMAGQQEFNLDQTQLLMLASFLQRGGTLMVERCGAGTGGGSGQAAGAFQRSFMDLAQELNRPVQPVSWGDPLLLAHHVFSQAPDGTDGPPRFLVGDGIVFSDGDFACLWDGGWPERPAARDTIRSATELGVNLGAYAAQRARQHHLKSFAQ
jgi:hypothetical protein